MRHSAITQCLSSQIANPETQWSLGTFGAIAEFVRDADELADMSTDRSSFSVVTSRGGVRITPHPDLRLFAFETITRESWSGRVALCLPQATRAMERRGVLTELGPDAHALRPSDRRAILFDLGFSALQVNTCVRISGHDVAAQLRAYCGQSLLKQSHPAMTLLRAHSPHRVFVSLVGRIEVFQPIPPPHGVSPEGPHTHVLPNLLRRERTHAATEPIPDGYVPCAHLYPAHPARDAVGRERPFDHVRHAEFPAILRKFGNPEFVALKERVAAAIAAGEDPLVIRVSDRRFARTNVRIMLRQLKAARQEFPALAAWAAAHEANRAETA
jgi:hypothetical protein